MQNVLAQAASIKNDSKIVLPFAKDLPLAMTDVRDTGAVGAHILVDPAPHAGKTYEFTGSLTTYGEFADVFSQALGRTISYVGVTPEQAAQAMQSRGITRIASPPGMLGAAATGCRQERPQECRQERPRQSREERPRGRGTARLVGEVLLDLARAGAPAAPAW